MSKSLQGAYTGGLAAGTAEREAVVSGRPGAPGVGTQSHKAGAWAPGHLQSSGLICPKGLRIGVPDTTTEEARP